MWLLTEWQHFNAQLEAEEKRALKIREFITLNEKLSLKNVTLEDIVEFPTTKDSLLNNDEFATKNSNQYTVITKGGEIPKHKKEHICFLDEHNNSDNTNDQEGLNKDDDNAIIDDVFQPDDAMTFCQRKALVYRVGLGIIAIVGCVCLLSLPSVPEKFLGIRSPQRVLMEYRLTPHPSNDSVLHPVEVNQSHAVHKRSAHRIPHKFWAKARPHNKFKKKKRYAHPQLQAPPEAPAGPVPNPQIIDRH